jgi:hypothetical protein
VPGLLDQANRERSLRCDRAREFQPASEQRIARHLLVREADGNGLIRLDLPAGHQQFHRLARGDPARQALRAAEARGDAEVDLGLSEHRVIRRDDPVAGERQLTAAAKRIAVHQRDRRHR